MFQGITANPFKNPFHTSPQNVSNQQSFQNWTIPESQSPFNDFDPPLNINGNGFYYNHNMTNDIIQPSTFGKKGGFSNPFVVRFYYNIYR